MEHGTYGHILSESAAEEGCNFVVREAFDVALARQRLGKGVAPRTFDNMLSSQAMCFNVFTPLSTRLALAGEVLRPFVAGLAEVRSITIEHTPARDIFNDQAGRGGVDCDLLMVGADTQGQPLVLVIETKFVEPDFSVCGFKKFGRTRKVDRYARTTCRFGLIEWPASTRAVRAMHTGSAATSTRDARLAVCTSANNNALLDRGEVLDGFRSLLRRPDAVHLIPLDELLGSVEAIAPPELRVWAAGLSARYRAI